MDAQLENDSNCPNLSVPVVNKHTGRVLQELESKIELLHENLETINRQTEREKAAIDDGEEEYEKMRHEMDLLQEQSEELNVKMKAMDRELNDKLAVKAELQRQSKELEDSLVRLTSQRKTKRTEHTTVIRELEQSRTKLQQTTNEVETLKQHIQRTTELDPIEKDNPCHMPDSASDTKSVIEHVVTQIQQSASTLATQVETAQSVHSAQKNLIESSRAHRVELGEVSKKLSRLFYDHLTFRVQEIYKLDENIDELKQSLPNAHKLMSKYMDLASDDLEASAE